MASDYDRKKEKFDEYMRRPLVDYRVIREMNRQLLYANTIDPDVARVANRILNG